MSTNLLPQFDFSEFFSVNYPKVLRFLNTRCANKQDAEDLASTAFEYCYRNLDRFDPTKASPESWLFLIVRSRWKNYCRDRRIYCDIDECHGILDDNDFAEQAAWLTDVRKYLYAALEELSEQQRKIIALRYFEGASDADIASGLSITQGNVRVIAHRALQKLRGLLPEDLMRMVDL